MSSTFIGYALVCLVCTYSAVLIAINFHALYGPRITRWWNTPRLHPRHRALWPAARVAAFLLPLFLLTAGATAHFVFIVPAPDAATAKLIMSETLAPDPDVDVTLIGAAKLVARNDAGQERPVTLNPANTAADHAYTVTLPDAQTRVIFGQADLGVTQRGQAKPFLLTYYPKTIIGDAFNPRANVGDKTPVEIVPIGKPGAVRFQLLINGKPAAAGIELTIIPPDGKEKKIATQPDGATPTLEQTGRYGVWARSFTPEAGERNGKKFDQTRRYTTLVADITTDIHPAKH